MTSRVLGVVRDQVLAYFFGAGDAMDAFRIAFRLPNVLRDLFAEGALSAALVPTFTRAIAGSRAVAWRAASNVINLLLIVSVVASVAGIVFAEPLIELYATGFRLVPGKMELTIRLTRIMFPFVAMVGVAAVLMALLNALHRFFVPALSPAMFNVATIAAAVLLVPIAPRLGLEPITIVAGGTLAGGLGQILLQWPAAAREGFRYQPVFDLRDPWLRETGRLMVPGIMGSGGGADQSLREQLARIGPWYRRGFLARLCLPPHVHADWAVRHLDRHGFASRHCRGRGRQGLLLASAARSRTRSA